MTVTIPTYKTWKAMPDGVDKAALAHLAPGEYGPWPVNVPRHEIVRMLEDALSER